MRTIEFRSDEIRVRVRAIMFGTPTAVQHHPEGWQQVTRVNRASYVQWLGAAGWEYQIPILFDGLHTNTSQQPAIRKLERCSVPDGKLGRPPLVTFDSKGDIAHDVHRFPGKRWVISTMEWQDYITKTAGSGLFRRVRQAGIVTVLEWTAEPVLITSQYNPNGSGGAAIAPSKYKVQKGDTLMTIALHRYGTKDYWRTLAKVNNIRDPNHLKVGSVILLP